MRFEIKILGANSAIPSNNRFPTSQLLSYHNNSYLIDCGEGTQIQMSTYKVKRSKIGQIFISHLHGDHIFGLPGIITSFSLQGRVEDLTIFGPVGIKKFIDTIIEVSQSHLTYKLIINEIIPDQHKKIFEDDHLVVYSFPLRHRIATSGYRFEEKRSKINIDPKSIEQHKLTGSQIKDLKAGGIILDYHGSPLSISDVSLPPKPRRSYSYCSDTVYDESIVESVKGSSYLYHEATYMDDMRAQAKERMHSTTVEAAQIASLSGVAQLIIGHYSSRYRDLQPLLEEAQAIFPKTALAIEGESFEILHDN